MLQLFVPPGIIFITEYISELTKI